MPEIKRNKMPEIGVLILAAGGSRRLGKPKQLLRYEQESLLLRIVNSVLKLQDILPMVVVGAQRELMMQELAAKPVDVIYNERWESGLATSIAVGLSGILQKNERLQGCLFVVCDQPFLNTAVLQQILDKQLQPDKGIVAAAYDGTVGTPVFFRRKYFEKLLQLSQDEGAKKVVTRHLSDLVMVPFAEGATDIDTQEDYSRLINGH